MVLHLHVYAKMIINTYISEAVYCVFSRNNFGRYFLIINETIEHKSSIFLIYLTTAWYPLKYKREEEEIILKRH